MINLKDVTFNQGSSQDRRTWEETGGLELLSQNRTHLFKIGELEHMLNGKIGINLTLIGNGHYFEIY